MKLLKQKDDLLLNRKNLSIEIEYPKSKVPSKEEIKKQIASFLKADEDLIIIKHIYPKFGTTQAEVIANIYNNANTLKELEKQKTKKEKKEAPKEKPKEIKEDAKKEEEKQEAK